MANSLGRVRLTYGGCSEVEDRVCRLAEIVHGVTHVPTQRVTIVFGDHVCLSGELFCLRVDARHSEILTIYGRHYRQAGKNGLGSVSQHTPPVERNDVLVMEHAVCTRVCIEVS